MSPRRAAPLLIALAVLGLGAETLRISATRLYPRYDEVAYLALARDFAREGGVAGTVRCYLEARCREDNRPPLYQFFLTKVVDDAPRSYADAKLVELAVSLLLLATVFAVTRLVFSGAVAAGSVIALCLMPVMPDYAARLMHDLLFGAITFAAVYAFAAWQERGPLAWLAAGALVGLAFLTKGSGHLLFVPLVAVALYRHRAALWRRPILYAAACGFVAVAFFLLWRNRQVWGSPLYNTNGRQVWLDQWRDLWAIQLTPEWSRVGIGWYLERHSLVDLALSIAAGAGKIAGVFIYTAGIGFGNAVARVATGLGVIALATLGMLRRWRAGHRAQLVAVLSTLGLYFVALALAARGGPGAQVRYVLPYVVLVLPYAVDEALRRLWPPLADRLAARWPRVSPAAVGTGALAVLLLGRLAVAAASSSAANPRSLYAVDPQAHQASVWLSQNLAPGERFALDYLSYYSTWDVPRPDSDPRWPFWLAMPAVDLQRFMDGSAIRKVLVDTTGGDYRAYIDKLSPETDAHGPLAFLGWPRCFADDAIPSRLLVYCRP